ncbi:hypothetical protein [Nocardia sp. NPDC020380]|uniref:hypothetical protein n=1 Tax=Nocardia sp. NPDC020380 TaxID=3364309 RepID=UPI0037AA0F7F
MTAFTLRKVHSCEFCGTEQEPVGDGYPTLDAARAAAATDAAQPLTWESADAPAGLPLWSDTDDANWRYYIESDSLTAD